MLCFLLSPQVGFCWHPRLAFGSLVLPLCGAALTFFAAAKKVSKESGLTPPILDRYPRDPVVPVLCAAACLRKFVANASNKCLTRFKLSCRHQRQRKSSAHLRQTVCR